MTTIYSGWHIMRKIKAIMFGCYVVMYLSLENYIASVVVL